VFRYQLPINMIKDAKYELFLEALNKISNVWKVYLIHYIK